MGKTWYLGRAVAIWFCLIEVWQKIRLEHSNLSLNVSCHHQIGRLLIVKSYIKELMHCSVRGWGQEMFYSGE